MESLEKYFDIAFAAPDGIQKLRELILTLAMQGKLVPQDPDDQPASELLKEIEAEKQRLVKEGKIKPSKPLPEIKPEEVPHRGPKSWVWVRLGTITNVVRGGSPRPAGDPQFYDGDIPFLKVADLTATNEMYLETYTYSIKEAGLHKTRMVPPNTLMLTNSGATLGIPKICTFETTFNDGIAAFIFMNEGLHKPFFYHLLASKTKYFLNEASRGQGQPNLNTEIIGATLIALPPLAEQHRIVAKIDQLMARCDELEKLRNERNQKRITIHTAALNRLLAAQNTRDFQTSWRFITQHFSELYTVKENVAELRKAILQLAVMGKLVPQDPEDQPASELLKEIEAEKQRLVKEGKIKPQKPLPAIKAKEVPFKLPKGWDWVRLAALAILIDYGTSKKTGDDKSKVPVYRMGNIIDGTLINKNLKYIDHDIEDLPQLYLQKNDILFNRTNSYELVGKSAIYKGEDDIATFASYLIRIRLAETKLFPRYFSMAMNASYFRKTQIEPEIVQQCGQANFNGTKLSATLIPLPPLPEQHRIVAKVDQLMTLCDQLEQQIDAATSKQTALLNTVMAELPPTSPTRATVYTQVLSAP